MSHTNSTESKKNTKNIKSVKMGLRYFLNVNGFCGESPHF